MEKKTDCVEVLSPFAYVKEYIDKGRLLIICDKEYEAWYYDTYIFDAITLAKRWKPEQITYDRITWLRYWIRENIQHGHDRETRYLRSMQSVKKWINQLIDDEYGHDEYWQEQKEDSLKKNAALYGR